MRLQGITNPLKTIIEIIDIQYFSITHPFDYFLRTFIINLYLRDTFPPFGSVSLGLFL